MEKSMLPIPAQLFFVEKKNKQGSMHIHKKYGDWKPLAVKVMPPRKSQFFKNFTV